MCDARPLSPEFSLAQFQSLIEVMYSAKDRERGVEGTFMWLMEEVGELSAELRNLSDPAGGDLVATGREFADVLAWLVTIANVAGVDLQTAVLEKYGRGCPGCGAMVCSCDTADKP